MDECPADAKHRGGSLRYQKEGFDEIGHERLALACTVPNVLIAGGTVDDEHHGKEAGKDPPERIDPGDAGEQEIEARPDSGLHALRDINHDEARNHEEQVHAGKAIGHEPVEQRDLAQAIPADGQGFHGANVIEDDQQRRESAQNLDGL